MRVRLLPFARMLVVAAVVAGCSNVADPWPEKPGPRVLTSFAPLYCFALNVAGDDASVLYLMSDTGPHHFNPSAQDAIALKRADLFLINGLDLDNGIARKLMKSARNKHLTLVEASSSIPLADLREGGCDCHKHGDGEHHDHAHGKYDPHVWLGIPQAIKMVERICEALIAQDEAHAAGYRERAANYIAKLEVLHKEGRELLANKKERELLTFHDSLHYFTKAFDLKVADSIEVAPGVEPDGKTMSELIKACKEKNVRVIAIEPQYDSNTSAKVILEALKKKDVPAEFVTIDPLETARPNELNAGFYETKMRANIRALADTLK